MAAVCAADTARGHSSLCGQEAWTNDRQRRRPLYLRLVPSRTPYPVHRRCVRCRNAHSTYRQSVS